MAVTDSNRPLLRLKLSYDGADADRQELDLYDVSVAMQGLHRSLAITTHAVLHGEIITQAPSLSGAEIRARPPTPGSWEIALAVVGLVGTAGATVVGGAFALATATRDNPLGHLIYSAYDAVVKATLGFHVDYDKSLGQSYAEYQAKARNARLPAEAIPPVLRMSQIDSIAEKVEVAVLTIHRPIYESSTATRARIMATLPSGEQVVGNALTAQTAEYLRFTERTDNVLIREAVVTSYNVNTFRGRVYVPKEGRPIPFELGEHARGETEIAKIAASLQRYATDPEGPQLDVNFRCSELRSRSERLKMYVVHQVIEDDAGDEEEEDWTD